MDQSLSDLKDHPMRGKISEHKAIRIKNARWIKETRGLEDLGLSELIIYFCEDSASATAYCFMMLYVCLPVALVTAVVAALSYGCCAHKRQRVRKKKRQKQNYDKENKQLRRNGRKKGSKKRDKNKSSRTGPLAVSMSIDALGHKKEIIKKENKKENQQRERGKYMDIADSEL